MLVDRIAAAVAVVTLGSIVVAVLRPTISAVRHNLRSPWPGRTLEPCAPRVGQFATRERRLLSGGARLAARRPVAALVRRELAAQRDCYGGVLVLVRAREPELDAARCAASIRVKRSRNR